MLTVWGATYSVYSRVLRLALLEKGIAHDWVEVDVFGDAADQAAQHARHPFGKIPTLDHDGFALYETGPCLRYLEGAFDGPALLPADPRTRARAEQIAAIADNYGYSAMVWGLFVEMISKPRDAEEPDQEVVREAFAQARIILDTIEALSGDGPDEALAGDAVSHADLFLAPVMAYFVCVPPARAMLTGYPKLSRWWQAWAERPSMTATRSPLEGT